MTGGCHSLSPFSSPSESRASRFCEIIGTVWGEKGGGGQWVAVVPTCRPVLVGGSIDARFGLALVAFVVRQ